jgi:hypothetical protein
VTSGHKFNCSKIFEFNNTSSVNFNLDDLRCYGRDLSNFDRLKQRITIRSMYVSQLELLVNEDVQLSLNETVFTQNCEGEEELDYTIDFPVSTSSCGSCGFFGDL